MPGFVPWEKYPALKLERLIAVAAAIRSGRNSAVLSHEPSKGDNFWTLGCVAYQRCCYALTELSDRCNWLTVLPEEQNRFTFAVGGVPLKFYKGPADDPPSRSLAVSYAELGSIQQSFDFGFMPDCHHLLRLAVETDRSGDVESVILVELEESGDVTDTYRIPDGTASIRPMMPNPVDPGPPTFTPLVADDATLPDASTGTDGNAR